MTGQIWSTPSEGGYMYADELSDTMRIQLQKMTKFRQLCDVEDGSKKGLHAGASFNWNVYSNISRQGRRLGETSPIPQAGFTISQKSLTVYEAYVH